MIIDLPNSAFLGNIDPFLNKMNLADEETLTITGNKNWISVHPMVISMLGAIGLAIKDKTKIIVHPLEAKSRHYFQRIGLFKILNADYKIDIIEHEASGRFIPLTNINNFT